MSNPRKSIHMSANKLALGLALALIAAMPAAAQIPVQDTGVMLQTLSTQPTVGSEIRRGGKAGFHCWGSMAASIKVLDQCVDAAINQNTLANTQYEAPFDLGVFVTAWDEALIKMTSKLDIDVREHAEIAEKAKYYFVQYVVLRKELGLTDDQVIASMGMARNIVGKDMTYWETHPEILKPNWKLP